MADRRELQKLPHTSTIYHLLLGPEVANPPSQLSILEETQTQVFAGESSGLTLMHGSFHIIQTPRVYRKLREELMAAWPDLEQPPSLATLEQLPYLVGRPSWSSPSPETNGFILLLSRTRR